MNTLNAQETYSGRRLQGYHHADEVLRQKVAIPRAVEQFQKTHKEFISQMSVVGHVAKQKHKDQALVNQLKSINMKTELQKYIGALAKNLYPVKNRLTVLTQQAFQQAKAKMATEDITPQDETIEFLCDLLPDMCPLLRMGQCLDNEDEEAFEDGLQWLHCIYECV